MSSLFPNKVTRQEGKNKSQFFGDSIKFKFKVTKMLLIVFGVFVLLGSDRRVVVVNRLFDDVEALSHRSS